MSVLVITIVATSSATFLLFAPSAAGRLYGERKIKASLSAAPATHNVITYLVQIQRADVATTEHLYTNDMEIAIGIGIGMVIALISGKKKRHTRTQAGSAKTEAEHKQQQQSDEELITVILPTINNDK